MLEKIAILEARLASKGLYEERSRLISVIGSVVDSVNVTIPELLNYIVATSYVLVVKLKNFHWNITGPFFNDLHRFFEQEYQILDDVIDLVAERIRTYDTRPLSSMAEFLEQSILSENFDDFSAKQMIADLVEDYSRVVQFLRTIVPVVEKKRDLATMDMLTGLQLSFEKTLWKLKSLAKDNL